MEIAERLRKVREQLGYTQREAAQRAGIRFQYLSNLENGRIANPSVNTLKKIAAAYGMGVDELIGQGVSPGAEELPAGLRELLADPDWAEQISPYWVETLLRIKHVARGLQTKEEFLEAFLALRRIFADS